MGEKVRDMVGEDESKDERLEGGRVREEREKLRRRGKTKEMAGAVVKANRMED